MNRIKTTYRCIEKISLYMEYLTNWEIEFVFSLIENEWLETLKVNQFKKLCEIASSCGERNNLNKIIIVKGEKA